MADSPFHDYLSFIPPELRGALDRTLEASVKLDIFTNATRPDATVFPAGTVIFNSDDAAPNYSDGTIWRDAAGVAT